MKSTVLDLHYMGARARLLDVAAFLDRLDRAEGDGDYRSASIKACLPILADGHPEKARRILERLSDPTTEPVEAAPGKGASGAWPDFGRET